MATTPLINGFLHEFASIEAKANGQIISGFKELSYSHKKEPAKQHGSSAQPIGRTRGQYDAEGSITMYKRFAQDLTNALGPGYMDVAFTITVNYQPDDLQGIITDTLVGCLIKNDEDSHSEGTDALVTKYDLDIMYIKKGGKAPISGLKE
jgi:hypothetical protein